MKIKKKRVKVILTVEVDSFDEFPSKAEMKNRIGRSVMGWAVGGLTSYTPVKFEINWNSTKRGGKNARGI